jgi:hypothetical protein
MKNSFRSRCLAGIFLVTAAAQLCFAGIDEQFKNPPPSANPWTFWFWVNGNVTKEGIRADLEDMKRVGIGGAMLFDGSMYIPPGPVRYGSDAWHEHVQYAIATADELGLQLGVMNCAGWATAGGPWISLEQSMKMLVWSRQPVSGGKLWKGVLPQPAIVEEFYREVAVLAVPEPESPQPELVKVEGKSAVFFYKAPAECRLLTIAVAEEQKYQGTVEASDDGESFRPVHSFEVTGKDWPMPIDIPFPPETALCFRVSMKSGKVAKGMLTLSNADRTGNLDRLTGIRPGAEEVSLPQNSPAVSPARIIDLSSQLKPDGSLEWQVPPGNWTVIRFGYTTTGARNHPAASEGTGLEVDKFDAAAVAYHFEQGLGRIIREAGAHRGKSLTAVVSDSWEAGPQTWTAAMPQLFKERRGYAMGTYLACLAGCIVGSDQETAAFLRDFRSTIGDLYAGNYYGTMARLAHENGLILMAEGYGGVLDEFKVDSVLDVPTVEFWNHDLYKSCGVVPSVAHTTGKPIVMSEAFTSRPPDQSRWKEFPFALKTLGDTAYTVGINRFTLHSYVHQPRSDIAPGFTHGRYGTHFGRLNSWWPLAQGWIDYLRRCQVLLQRGTPVADFIFLSPEKLQTEERDLNFPWPEGYKGDFLSVNQLASVTVENGRMKSAGGTQYRVLILPGSWTASAETLRQLKRLHKAGAVIYGAKPVSPSGLLDITAGRAAWEAEVNDWPFAARPQTFSFPPDFRADKNLRFTHRADEGADFYFVTNPEQTPVDVRAEFRVTGRKPELWDPATGQRLPDPSFRMGETQTGVQLSLDPAGSVFVVFRNSSPVRDYTAPALAKEKSLPVTGPWQVAFQKGRGAPASIELPELIDWTKHSDDGVKYFSGTATYRQEFSLPASVVGHPISLDLGEVCDMAEVRVNGQSAGILWKPPFVADVTGLVRPGKNLLSVTVANRWINRLIGDEQLPPEADYVASTAVAGALTEFPAWWNDSGKPRQRITFSTWKHYSAGEPLVKSGLIGPVRLLITE